MLKSLSFSESHHFPYKFINIIHVFKSNTFYYKYLQYPNCWMLKMRVSFGCLMSVKVNTLVSSFGESQSQFLETLKLPPGVVQDIGIHHLQRNLFLKIFVFKKTKLTLDACHQKLSSKYYNFEHFLHIFFFNSNQTVVLL